MIVHRRAKIQELVRYAGLPFAMLLMFDICVAVSYVYLGCDWIALPHLPLALVGSGIGFLVSFRNTGAYARWWEARQLWGSIVNDSRSLTRQMISLLKPDHVDRIARLQIAYVHALRAHLRKQDLQIELRGWLSEADLNQLKGVQNGPAAIQLRLANELRKAVQLSGCTDVEWVSLDETLTRLMSSQGGLERIKTTPMPQQYDDFLRFFSGIYCILLPLGLVENLGLMSPIGSSLVGFIFIVLDRMGRDLENPFENKPYDVAMTAIATTIEINLLQMIGAGPIPLPLEPQRGVLM